MLREGGAEGGEGGRRQESVSRRGPRVDGFVGWPGGGPGGGHDSRGAEDPLKAGEATLFKSPPRPAISRALVFPEPGTPSAGPEGRPETAEVSVIDGRSAADCRGVPVAVPAVEVRGVSEGRADRFPRPPPLLKKAAAASGETVPPTRNSKAVFREPLDGAAESVREIATRGTCRSIGVESSGRGSTCKCMRVVRVDLMMCG